MMGDYLHAIYGKKLKMFKTMDIDLRYIDLRYIAIDNISMHHA